MQQYSTGDNPASGPKGIPEDVSAQLTTSMVGLMAQRTQELESVQSTRSAKARRLGLERERLARKLPADSPRLAALDARIEENHQMVASIRDEVFRSKTPLPTPARDAWTVFGSVRDGKGTGIPDLTIAFYDESGRPAEALGYTCTCKEGYFRHEVRGDVIQQTMPVYLRVLDRDGNVLYVDRAKMVPRIKGIDYRDIILDKNACVPPRDPNAGGGRTGDPVKTDDPPKGEDPPKGDEQAVPYNPNAELQIPGGAAPGATQGSDTSNWIVRGRVVDASGKPAAGMKVTLKDKDFLFDDRIGQAETDRNGAYELAYTPDTFRDFMERKPDIYLTVADPSGKQLYRSKKVLRPEVGKVEIVDVKLSK